MSVNPAKIKILTQQGKRLKPNSLRRSFRYEDLAQNKRVEQVSINTLNRLMELPENQQIHGPMQKLRKKILLKKVNVFYNNETKNITSFLHENKNEIINLGNNYYQKLHTIFEQNEVFETFDKDYARKIFILGLQKKQKEFGEEFSGLLSKSYNLDNIQPNIVTTEKIEENAAAGWCIIGGEIKLTPFVNRIKLLIPSLIHEFTHMRQDLITLQTYGKDKIIDLLFNNKEIRAYLAKSPDPKEVLKVGIDEFIYNSQFMNNFLSYALKNKKPKNSIEGMLGKVNLKENTDYISYKENPKKHFLQFREQHAYFVDETSKKELGKLFKGTAFEFTV